MIDPLPTIRAAAPPEWPAAPWLWDELAARYASPPRHYHTLHHVAEVATAYAAVDRWDDPRGVFLAVLAHDAIYDVARADNEEQSALVAREWAERLGLPSATAERLVRATAGHAGPPPGDDADLLAFLDCDLAILGAEPARYDAYADGVRAEYTALVPAELYALGRARFLDQLLAAPAIFHTRADLDASARANLARERLRYG